MKPSSVESVLLWFSRETEVGLSAVRIVSDMPLPREGGRILMLHPVTAQNICESRQLPRSLWRTQQFSTAIGIRDPSLCAFTRCDRRLSQSLSPTSAFHLPGCCLQMVNRVEKRIMRRRAKKKKNPRRQRSLLTTRVREASQHISFRCYASAVCTAPG